MAKETIEQILDRIGDDATAARDELAIERRRSRQRVTLIEKLIEIIDGDPTAPPADLEDSERFWRATLNTYSLRVDELRILEDACRTMDLIDRLERALRDSPLMELGSMGQPVASPLVSEVRQHRSTLRQLLGQLKLPDEPGQAASPRSTQARAAAMSRWRS